MSNNTNKQSIKSKITKVIIVVVIVAAMGLLADFYDLWDNYILVLSSAFVAALIACFVAIAFVCLIEKFKLLEIDDTDKFYNKSLFISWAIITIIILAFAL